MEIRRLASIWLHPRETLQEVVDTDPRTLFFPLATVWGTHGVLHGAVFQQSVDPGSWITLPSILPIAILVGAVAGATYFYVFSYLLGGLGKLLGSEGSFAEARATMAWSSVPFLVLLLIDFALLTLWGEAVLAHTLWEIRDGAGGPSLAVAAWAELCLRALLSVWSYVIYVRGFSQVFRLPMPKALLATLITEAVRIVSPLIAWNNLLSGLMLPIGTGSH